MKRTKEYLVYWRRESDGEWGMEYINAQTAQGAADVARECYMIEGAEITLVAEVRKNWK